MLACRLPPTALRVFSGAGMDECADRLYLHASATRGPHDRVVLCARQAFVETTQHGEDATWHDKALIAERQAEQPRAPPCTECVDRGQRRTIPQKAQIEVADAVAILGNESVE